MVWVGVGFDEKTRDKSDESPTKGLGLGAGQYSGVKPLWSGLKTKQRIRHKVPVLKCV